jgi:hypothetical protein
MGVDGETNRQEGKGREDEEEEDLPERASEVCYLRHFGV